MVYQLDLRAVLETRSIPLVDLSDLVAWLPPGCALWRAYGGPAAWTDEVRALLAVEYAVRVSDFHQTKGKGKKPEPPKMPPYAHEDRSEVSHMQRQAEARARRKSLG